MGDSQGFCQLVCNISFYGLASNAYVCLPCSTRCYECINVGDEFCTTCAKTDPDYPILQPTNLNDQLGYCQSQCDAHYVVLDASAAHLLCQLCHASCGNCVASNDAEKCTTCDQPTNPSNGYFQEKFPFTGTGYCQDYCYAHYYQDASTLA